MTKKKRLLVRRLMPIFAWLLPLGVSFLYAIASLIIKQAMARGAGPIRIIFITNWMLLGLWMCVFFQHPGLPSGSFWWAPFVAGTCRVIGGGCLMMALRLGDVSVQTPLGGLKVIFVALFAVLIGAEALCPTHWIAAGCTLISVYLLGKRPEQGVIEKKRLGRAVVLSFFSAILFAINDVLAAKAAVSMGVSTYLAFNYGTAAVGSLAFIPFFRGRLRDLPANCLPWVFGGAILLAIDVIGLSFAIAFYQEATTANVLYAARGIWAILLVWFVGQYFYNEEGKLGTSVMMRRLLGASLLFLAIIMVLCF